jgi:type IV pilus assembly protein PilM
MRASLPLGIDIGSTRLRVVHVRRTSEGAHVHGIAVREIPAGIASSGAIADTAHVAALLEDAREELKVRERRCVLAIGEPDAMLRAVQFPKMSFLERERSARFEAQRHAPFPIDEAVVRVHRLGGERAWTVGVARSAAILTRSAAVRGAGLKAIAVDHEACALARAFPSYEAVLDVGYKRTSLHVYASPSPITLQTLTGGADVTRAIERDLAVDEGSAEKRKRIIGTAGAGERAKAALIADSATLIEHGRRIRPIARIALCGNGSRLAGFRCELQERVRATIETPVTALLRGDYPEDVLHSGAADWTLAAGLAQWAI